MIFPLVYIYTTGTIRGVQYIPSKEGVAKVLDRLSVGVGGASSERVRGQGLSVLRSQMKLLKTVEKEEGGGGCLIMALSVNSYNTNP